MAKTQAKTDSGDPAAESKRRARRRLIGAVAVSGIAAMVLALVLDREPRPVTPEVVMKGAAGTAITTAPAPAASAPTVSAPMPSAPVVVAPATPEPASPNGVATSTAQADIKDGKDTKDSKSVTRDEPRRPPLVLNAPEKTLDPIEKITKEKSVAEKSATAPKTDSNVKTDSATKIASANKTEVAQRSGYALQVGAFSSKDSANNALAKIKSAGLTGFTEIISTPQGERIRVRAGPYKDRDAAQAAMARLKTAGIEAALIAPN